MKTLKKAVVFLLALLLASAALCQNVFADSRSYDIISYTVNVVVDPDGSADVTERIT